MNRLIEGFSSMSREEKLLVASKMISQPVEFIRHINAHYEQNNLMNELYSEFSENAVSNFYLPYSLVPNFLVNGKTYIIPMVTEESSVVAAAAAAAKFWYKHGGFVTNVSQMLKPGHIHFFWKGPAAVIHTFIEDIIPGLFSSVKTTEQSMRARGGGIQSIRLCDDTHKIPGYYRIEVLFDTVDAMGANFINSCLETMTEHLKQQAETAGLSSYLDVIMSILSNYTPQCTVQCSVGCAVQELDLPGMTGEEFARRMEAAILISQHDINRAVTHNKGIYNGIDAVVIATGNDSRATAAAGHAGAVEGGHYRGLSSVLIENSEFSMTLTVPLPLGVVGGVTNLHPLANASLQLLNNPDASQLMSIAASAGMANHFSALKSLVYGGIQKGHMKMHLSNLLTRLGATHSEKELARIHFETHPVNANTVRVFLNTQRKKQAPV